MVVCCRRSCLGLAVTRANGFKMDSLSPCFRSMGLSEDTEQEEEEEEKKSVLHPHHLTHSCDPSALAILTEQVSGLFLADWKIRDCLFRKISSALRGGKRSARKRLLRPRMPRCSEPCTSHMRARTHTHTHWLCAHVKREG